MYCGYVTTIQSIRKHTNADRLQCATVYGNNVIVDLSYKQGDKVVYFPVDGQLGKEFAEENNLVRKKDENGNNIGGYLDPDKRNITALKLRGEKSDGLVLPIRVLSKYTNTDKLKDGTEITVLNGVEICRKYIPNSNRVNRANDKKGQKVNSKELKKKVSYPFFREHADTEQLAYHEDAFRPGDTIYLTRKLHGTSARIANAEEITVEKAPKWKKKLFHASDKVIRDYKTVSGTRRVVLNNFDGGFYGSNEFRKQYHDYFNGLLPKGMTVYGEIVGWVDENTPIMPRCQNSKVKDKEFQRQYGKETVFTYGCKPGENDLYVYRITMCNEDGVTIELPAEEVMAWCDTLKVKYVPLLEKFLYTDFEDLNKRCEKYLDIPEPLANGSHVAEGVVVRIDNRSTFTAYKTKGWYFKILEGIIKDSSEVPDMEEAQELIGDEPDA